MGSIASAQKLVPYSYWFPSNASHSQAALQTSDHADCGYAPPAKPPSPLPALSMSPQDAAHHVERLCSTERPDLFMSMNRQIIKNLSIGVYDGCKVAVELARDLAKL